MQTQINGNSHAKIYVQMQTQINAQRDNKIWNNINKTSYKFQAVWQYILLVNLNILNFILGYS